MVAVSSCFEMAVWEEEDEDSDWPPGTYLAAGWLFWALFVFVLGSVSSMSVMGSMSLLGRELM